MKEARQKKVSSVWFHLCIISGNANKFIVTESRSAVVLDWKMRKLLEVMKVFLFLLWWWFHRVIHRLKVIKSYTLNMCNLCYVKLYLNKVERREDRVRGWEKDGDGGRKMFSLRKDASWYINIFYIYIHIYI